MKKIKIVTSKWDDKLLCNRLVLKDAEGYPIPKSITPYNFTVIKGKYLKENINGWYVIDDATGIYVVKNKTKAGAIDTLMMALKAYENHIKTITYENQKKNFQELLKEVNKVE